MPSISVPTALAIGVSVSGVAGIAGSALQSGATSSSAGKATAAQLAQQQQERADLAPWTGTPGTANTDTSDLLGLNGPDAATAAMAKFQTSPGYQWQLGQGLRAVDAGAASQGMLRSGATLKAEQTFGSGLADQDFTNYYNRLFDLSKLGESAAALRERPISRRARASRRPISARAAGCPAFTATRRRAWAPRPIIMEINRYTRRARMR